MPTKSRSSAARANREQSLPGEEDSHECRYSERCTPYERQQRIEHPVLELRLVHGLRAHPARYNTRVYKTDDADDSLYDCGSDYRSPRNPHEGRQKQHG